jgi:pilus assembly protein CpaD
MARQSYESLKRKRRAAAAAVTIAGLALSACTADRAVTGSTYPTDYRVRHPIILTDAPRTLDVIVNLSGVLDPRQHDDIRAFALEFRRYGRGPLLVEMPTGGKPAAMHAARRTLEAVRASIRAEDLPGGAIATRSYSVADPIAASAIRLSFNRVQAKVTDQCGLWPQDLGVGDPGFNFRNEPYWNLGCASQSTLAAQVADPVDLVRGRTEGRIDTLRRSKDIENLRQAKDPSTDWKQDGKTSTKQQVSQ